MKLLGREALKDKGIPHSETQLWRLVKAGKFPKPIKVGGKNAWVESEIDTWIEARMAARAGQAA